MSYEEGMGTTVEVTYFYGNDWWARAHRTGCRDAAKEQRQDGNDGPLIHTVVASERELIEEAAVDFIFANDQQAWTDYIGQVSLAPCLHLPREATA